MMAGTSTYAAADCLPFTVGGACPEDGACSSCDAGSGAICRWDAHSMLPVPGPGVCYVPGGATIGLTLCVIEPAPPPIPPTP